MSRSNPHEGNPNPAVRWFEWNGEKGGIRYYDKEAKKNVEVGTEFTFVLLDQLGSVRGWHEASQSGIYSNEVKDTSQDLLVVKSFKGGILAEGIYRDIKDSVNAKGGRFVANLYIGFKHNGSLALGSLRFKGSALGAWMDFTKANRGQLYAGAVQITGSTTGKKGRITFHVPTFALVGISQAANDQAIGLDRTLQSWLDGYLKRTKHDQAEHAADDDETVSEDESFPMEEIGAPVGADEDLRW